MKAVEEGEEEQEGEVSVSSEASAALWSGRVGSRSACSSSTACWRSRSLGDQLDSKEEEQEEEGGVVAMVVSLSVSQWYKYCRGGEGRASQSLSVVSQSAKEDEKQQQARPSAASASTCVALNLIPSSQSREGDDKGDDNDDDDDEISIKSSNPRQDSSHSHSPLQAPPGRKPTSLKFRKSDFEKRERRVVVAEPQKVDVCLRGMPGRGYPPFPLPPGVLLPPGSYPPGYLLPPAPAPPGLPGMMPPFLPPPGAPYGMVPGLLPPGGLPPRLVYPLGLPPVAPPPPAPTLGPPAGFGLAPQVIASAAPVLRIPPAPSLTPSSSSSSINASNSMQVFNTNNTQFAFLTQTSNLLNRHIFTNAQAGLPITIVAGTPPPPPPPPPACGKITKYVRPSDPISLLPATFAVISYAQAICAMRAVNLLRDYLVNEDTDERIDIKLGKKEKVAIESIHKSEQEAVQSLPADAHLDDVYEPIRQSIANALRGVGQAVPLNLTAPQPPPALLQMQQDVNDKVSEAFLSHLEAGAAAGGGGAVSEGSAGGGGGGGESTTAPTASSSSVAANEGGSVDGQVPVEGGGGGGSLPQNYYDFLQKSQEAGEEEVDVDRGESILLSEIGRFRERQMQRDQ
eukprot:scaffold725_cov162-Ochromonas_danica.AAC.27